MDWIKLFTAYAADLAIATGDDAAEVMFTRGMAYCGANRTGGFIPDAQLHNLTRHPHRARRIVKQLTRVKLDGEPGPWEVVEGGYRIRNWHHYQDQLEAIEERRRNDRDRKRRQRARERQDSDLVTGQSRDSHAEVTVREEEGDEDAAAAATYAAAAELPGPIAVLCSKLRAHTALRGLRSDTLKPDQQAELVALIDLHGDQPLVDVALNTLRHPAPTHASAFLGTWRSLPAPGQRLHVVRPQHCPVHSTTLTPSGACSSCAADQIAKETHP